jgi:GTP-binding protein EngB required for normal cell division
LPSSVDQQIRVETALEPIKRFAKQHSDESTVREAQWLADRLASGELTVLIAGQFKRGKSTLINALLGEEILPTGVLPLTSVATMIHFGERRRAIVGFRDGGSTEIVLPDLSRYVSEKENPENRLGVAHVDVEVPAAILGGVRLVDTPGIASTFAHNTETARAALREADAAVLVVGPEPPIGEAELAFAKEVRDAAERLFVVLNKVDMLPGREAELIEFTAQQLRKALGFTPRIFALSALSPKDARFAAFSTELREFLVRHRDTARERSLARKCVALARRLAIAIAIKRHAMLLPTAKRRSAYARFKELARGLHERAEDLGAALDRGLREDGKHIDEVLQTRFEDARRRCVNDLTPIAETGNADELERALEAWAADESRKWVDAVATVLENSTQRHVDRLQSRLRELEEEVLRLGLQALNVQQNVPTVALEAFDVPGMSLTREYVVDTGLELVLRGGLGFVPAKLRARVLRRRLEELVRERLDARRGRLRHTALRELDRLGRTLRASVERRLLAAENAVAAALDEALQTPESELQARAKDLIRQEAELQGLAERLEPT